MAMHWFDRILAAVRPKSVPTRANAKPTRAGHLSAAALLKTLAGHQQDTNTVHPRLKR